MKRGFDVLRDKALNRSITFGRKERDRLGLRGLLPYSVATDRQMVARLMANLERLPRDINRYMLLSSVQERNERLFYQTVIEHIDQILPLIYTPTVGEACREFSHIAREPKGFFITPDDRGHIRRILGQLAPPQGHSRHRRHRRPADPRTWRSGRQRHGHPDREAGALHGVRGRRSRACLPVTLDVGTNNEALRQDVLYLGYPRKRLAGKAYFDLVDEFVTAVQARYPDALLQFEDFLTPNAFALLTKYRDRVLCFNDDIQGTAAVALAGVYASTRLTGVSVPRPEGDVPGRGVGRYGHRRPDDGGLRRRGPEPRGGPAASLVRRHSRARREGADRSDGAQPAVRARPEADGVRRGDRGRSSRTS